MESCEEWMRRIGSKDAMANRQERRLNRVINQPIPRRKAQLGGKEAHSLHCKCVECIPDSLRAEMRSWPVVTPGMHNARPVPVTVIKSKDTAPKKRRGKWDEQRGTSGN